MTTFFNFGVPLLLTAVAKEGGFLSPCQLHRGCGVWPRREPYLAEADADHGDARGRRFLHEGVFMAFTLPYLTLIAG
jgi:hypothetical protein